MSGMRGGSDWYTAARRPLPAACALAYKRQQQMRPLRRCPALIEREEA